MSRYSNTTMRHPAKLLSLTVLSALLVILTGPKVNATSPTHPTLILTAPSPPTLSQNPHSDRLAEADQLLHQGIEQSDVNQFREAIQFLEQALKIYQETDVREAFPEESRVGEGRVLGNLGHTYLSLAEYERAIDFYQQVLTIFQEIGDRRRESAALGNLGNAYNHLGQYERAINFSQQSLDIVREIGIREAFPEESRAGEGAALVNLGNAYLSLAEYERAIDFYQQGLVILQEIGDRAGEGIVLGNLGVVYKNLSQYEQAIAFSERHLAIAREIGDRVGEGLALGNLGVAYLNLGQYQQAIAFSEQHLAIAREIGDRAGESRALGNLGVVYAGLSQYQQAIAFSERHLAIAREVGDRAGEGHALGSLGSVYSDLSQYERAIDLYQQQLTINREIGNRAGEGYALGNLGAVYTHLSQYERAIGLYQQTLAIMEDIGDRAGEGIALGNLGNAYSSLSQYERAINFHTQELAIAQETGNLAGESNALKNLGHTYFDLGQYEQAINFHAQSLAIAHEIGDRAGEGTTLGNLGNAYLRLRKYEQTVDLYEQSLAIAREIGDRAGEGTTLGNLGVAYFDLGQYERAIDLYEKSLAIAREIGNRASEGLALGNLGVVYKNLGQYEQAIAQYRQALTLFNELGARFEEGRLLGNIGGLLNQQDHPELAIIFLKASIEVREMIRGDIRGLDTELQQSFTGTVAGDYRLLANLLLEQGRIPEAQQVLDLLKLEELREFTDTTRATWTGNTLEYSYAEQAVITAHDSIVALGGEIVACEDTNCAELSELDDQLEALKAQYDQQVTAFQATIRANRADDEIFQNPDNLSGDAEELLSAYAAHGQTALLIYPFVLEDKLWLVFAAQGSVIGSLEVPVSQSELSTTVQRFGELLTASTRLDELQATSQQLYDWLIQPLESELAANDIDHLVFVNDRVTRYIPMAALYDGEQYLLERYTISTVLAPGLTDTTDKLESIDQSQVLGLGLTQAVANFSPLPAVDIELDAIVRSGADDALGIYPGQVLLNDAFTLDTLKENVRDHRVLHMATHAAFVPGRPEESFVVLGNGEQLKVSDIEAMERRLGNLHLVVLSACQTALGGAAEDGTEIAGISSYFLEKGRAEAVLASLWAVNDTSTSILMQRFYELLSSGELTKAEALRQAQLSLLYDESTETRLAAATRNAPVPTPREGFAVAVAEPGYRHPYYWAPFILIGNGL
ncbi:MAG: tetratricopeptide repeat protein [Leptolyngbya sp. SIOISBB]|nr:tetratricopeptide repeat protein [Leptolyngbya sp. SIOISBB]